MDDSPATRRSLIVKLRDPADSAAWGEFVALYEPLVYRLARRKGLQDADARDLCQEVFQAVARAVDRWEPGRGSFRGWLSRITRNLLINFLTRGQQQPRGTGATSMQEMLEAQPAADPSATALFEAEYERRLFQWAADEVRGEVTSSTWQTVGAGGPPPSMRMIMAALPGAAVRVVAVLVVVIVVVMRMLVAVCLSLPAGDGLGGGQYQPAGLDALGADQAIREFPDLARLAAQQDHFEASILVEVHMSCRDNMRQPAVLEFGEPLRGSSRVVVVDQRDHPHRLAFFLTDHFLDECSAHEAADCLASIGITMLLAVAVEFLQ